MPGESSHESRERLACLPMSSAAVGSIGDVESRFIDRGEQHVRQRSRRALPDRQREGSVARRRCRGLTSGLIGGGDVTSLLPG